MPWLKKQLDFHQIIVAAVTNLVRFTLYLQSSIIDAELSGSFWEDSLQVILNHHSLGHIIHQSTHFLPHQSLLHDAFPRMLCNWCCWHAAKRKESSPELESASLTNNSNRSVDDTAPNAPIGYIGINMPPPKKKKYKKYIYIYRNFSIIYLLDGF